MSGIGPVQQLVAVIRAQFAARGAPARAAAPARRARPAPALPALDALIAGRVRAIAPEDPQRRRKAFRVFLEAVLLAQLGPQLINDAAFYQLVDEVHAALEAEPAVQALVAQATDELLQP